MKRTLIEQLLPEVFQRTLRPGSALLVILEVMEALHAPSEEVLEELAEYFSPYHTPDHFVPHLAGWVDLGRYLGSPEEGADSTSPPCFPSGLGRLRELIAAAAFLSQWRGTAKGLLRFLETATGVEGFEIEEHVTGANGQPQPFHVLIRAPAEAERYRGLVERIIEAEKPAYVTYELTYP